MNLESLTLKSGSHRSFEQGACLMEAVSYVAGEPFSDHPQCTDVALAAFGRSLNDRMTDDERQMLKPLIPRLVGTRGSSDLARRRAYLLVDRHVRVAMPALFRELPNKPRSDIAERFEALAPVMDRASAEAARDLARSVRDELRRDLTPKQAAAAAASAVSAAAYAYAYAYADAAADAADAYAYADAYADAYACDDAYADAYACDALKASRARSLALAIGAFEEAIALTEAP